jgi:hypothetical protein
VAGGSPIPELPAIATVAAPPPPSPHSGSAHDSISKSLMELTLPPMRHLLQVGEVRLFPAGMPLAESIHITALDAKDGAEKSVAKAAYAIEMAGDHSQRVAGNPDPRAVLALASRFIETGQFLNHLRAAELGSIRERDEPR